MDKLFCVLHPSKSGASHFVFRHASWFQAFFIEAKFPAAIYLTIHLKSFVNLILKGAIRKEFKCDAH